VTAISSLHDALKQQAQIISGKVATLKTFLTQGSLPDSYTSDLEQIDQATQRLMGLIEDMEKPLPEGKSAQIESYVSHLRHDMRTPINAIRGYSEVVLEEIGNTSETTVPFTEIIHTTDTILSHITQIVPAAWTA
jgi:signal transduction histidine kinase